MDILTQQLINGLVLGSVYALVALGYKPPEARRMLDRVPESVTSVEELLRAVLRSAAGAKS